MTPLLAADETVHQTRTTLWAGRGNVRGDLIRTDHDCSRRTIVSRIMSSNFDIPSVTDAEYENGCAAIAAAAGSGNCGEHAAIALRLHGNPKRIEAEHVVSQMMSTDPELDHSWVVLALTADEDSPKIVIDPWMRGPAVMLEDTQPIHNFELRTTVATVSGNEAHDLYGDFQFGASWFLNRAADIQQQVMDMEHAGNTGIHEDDICNEVDVTSEAFRLSVITAAAQLPTDHFSLSIPVVAAARAFGANVKGAVAFTRNVITELTQTPEL